MFLWTSRAGREGNEKPVRPSFSIFYLNPPFLQAQNRRIYSLISCSAVKKVKRKEKEMVWDYNEEMVQQEMMFFVSSILIRKVGGLENILGNKIGWGFIFLFFFCEIHISNKYLTLCSYD